MTEGSPPSDAQRLFGSVVPKLAELSDQVLFGDIWERPQLAKRDRSLITCAALIMAGKTDLLRFHLPLAVTNGVTQQEAVEMITHLAFYAGWPQAVPAATLAQELFGKERV